MENEKPFIASSLDHLTKEMSAPGKEHDCAFKPETLVCGSMEDQQPLNASSLKHAKKEKSTRSKKHDFASKSEMLACGSMEDEKPLDASSLKHVKKEKSAPSKEHDCASKPEILACGSMEDEKPLNASSLKHVKKEKSMRRKKHDFASKPEILACGSGNVSNVRPEAEEHVSRGSPLFELEPASEKEQTHQVCTGITETVSGTFVSIPEAAQAPDLSYDSDSMIEGWSVARRASRKMKAARNQSSAAIETAEVENHTDDGAALCNAAFAESLERPAKLLNAKELAHQQMEEALERAKLELNDARVAYKKLQEENTEFREALKKVDTHIKAEAAIATVADSVKDVRRYGPPPTKLPPPPPPPPPPVAPEHSEEDFSMDEVEISSESVELEVPSCDFGIQALKAESMYTDEQIETQSWSTQGYSDDHSWRKNSWGDNSWSNSSWGDTSWVNNCCTDHSWGICEYETDISTSLHISMHTVQAAHSTNWSVMAYCEPAKTDHAQRHAVAHQTNAPRPPTREQPGNKRPEGKSYQLQTNPPRPPTGEQPGTRGPQGQMKKNKISQPPTREQPGTKGPEGKTYQMLDRPHSSSGENAALWSAHGLSFQEWEHLSVMQGPEGKSYPMLDGLNSSGEPEDLPFRCGLGAYDAALWSAHGLFPQEWEHLSVTEGPEGKRYPMLDLPNSSSEPEDLPFLCGLGADDAIWSAHGLPRQDLPVHCGRGDYEPALYSAHGVCPRDSEHSSVVQDVVTSILDDSDSDAWSV